MYWKLLFYFSKNFSNQTKIVNGNTESLVELSACCSFNTQTLKSSLTFCVLIIRHETKSKASKKHLSKWEKLWSKGIFRVIIQQRYARLGKKTSSWEYPYPAGIDVYKVSSGNTQKIKHMFKASGHRNSVTDISKYQLGFIQTLEQHILTLSWCLYC